MKKRVIRVALVILVLIVAGFHAIWFYNYKKYTPFIDAVGEGEWGGYSYYDENKITFAVCPPKYPTFVGNLSISDFQSNNLSIGDKIVDMIIWPQINNRYEIGISIRTVTNVENSGDKNNGMYSISTESVNFVLDENMNFLQDYDDEQISLFNENKEKIEEYYGKANQMWGILN
jgi:hypothetical protein